MNSEFTKTLVLVCLKNDDTVYLVCGHISGMNGKSAKFDLG